MSIFTIGYEKKTIAEFIQVLKKSRITVLVDVREVAWSYKRDFCKTRFSTALSNAGIKYIHIKQLGNPRAIRKNNVGVSAILEEYREYLRNTESGIGELLDLINDVNNRNGKICLTCYEKDFACCHRSVIVDYIKHILKKDKIVHL